MKRIGIAVGLLLGGAGLLAWALFGLVSGDETGSVEARPERFSVQAAREFDEFAVYWVGESFQGLPLAAVQRISYPGEFPGQPYNHPQNEVAFIYGDCEIAPGNTGCPMPLSITVRPYCEIPPEVVAQRAKARPPEVIRGATVQRLAGGTLQMWTQDASISIAAIDQGILTAAVHNLVRLNGDGRPASPQEDLGPPDAINCPPQPGLRP